MSPPVPPSGNPESPDAESNLCCGGPPSAEPSACCARDEAQKAAGRTGCGCVAGAGPAPASPVEAAAVGPGGCCGQAVVPTVTSGCVTQLAVARHTR